MSLFFDSEWFDDRLTQAGLKRHDLAVALGLGERELGEMWKDQREVSADDVRVIAALLGVSREDVARRAGISTPVPNAVDDRLARIEADINEIKTMLLELRAGR
ncbi:MAG: hypothetical protein WDM89_16095 [Rhizomicrobium sp.]